MWIASMATEGQLLTSYCPEAVSYCSKICMYCPPKTDVAMPALTFNSPPDTDERSPEAMLECPPEMQLSPPMARLSSPPGRRRSSLTQGCSARPTPSPLCRTTCCWCRRECLRCACSCDPNLKRCCANRCELRLPPNPRWGGGTRPRFRCSPRSSSPCRCARRSSRRSRWSVAG